MLEEEGLKVTDIRQMKKTEKTQVPMPRYVVEISTDQKNQMNNLTSICGFRVQVEQYRQPKKATPMFQIKCCDLPETCAICAGNHHSKLCPQKLQSTIAYKCANCEGSHRASNKERKHGKKTTANARIKISPTNNQQHLPKNSQKMKQTLANFPPLQITWAEQANQPKPQSLPPVMTQIQKVEETQEAMEI
ncbi:hypothetical protein PR048_005304 [Dryococelus australis]|uniref:Pre-C2HC domain-containing protein n=1 Tax=Dryococelus australis TaxID=614101 RepID=A0ABQ9I7U1_9NEOP|nr:hypothetical protein PR048_005304 [Dryococelus australis]